MHRSILIENISLSRNCDILKQQNKNSKLLKKHIYSLLNSPITYIIPAMDFISVQLIALTNHIHRIPDQFVSKPQNFSHHKDLWIQL